MPPPDDDPFPVPAALVWRPAGLVDTEAVLGSMRAFYREEQLRFDDTEQGTALQALLARPALGAVFLADAGEAGPPGPAGHLVLTWACSLEFGGRFVLLDELYLVPGARGRGEGRRAVDFAVAWARAHEAKALRLEVAHENPRARHLYRKTGLEAQTRDPMTLRLA